MIGAEDKLLNELEELKKNFSTTVDKLAKDLKDMTRSWQEVTSANKKNMTNFR